MLQDKIYDVIVIGAGAAGLMAAGTAAMNGRKVLLMEKMERAGRKIRITGKGRCPSSPSRGPYVCSLCLILYFCFVNKFMCTVFF